MLHSQLESFQKMENLMFSVLKSFCLLCWVRSFLPKFIPMTDFGSSGLVWMKLPCDKPGWGFKILLQLQWVSVAGEGREGTHLCNPHNAGTFLSPSPSSSLSIFSSFFSFSSYFLFFFFPSVIFMLCLWLHEQAVCRLFCVHTASFHTMTTV